MINRPSGVKLSFHFMKTKARPCFSDIQFSCPISNLSLALPKETVLTGEYIAGLTQASDRAFSATLVRRTTKNKHSYRIDLKFTIQLIRNESNKDILLYIKEKFDNKGNLILYKQQNNTIKYQVTNIKDLLDVVIPFFMKYHLRGDKLLSFLRFKYIAETVFFAKPSPDGNVFLSLKIIAGQVNYQDKLGKKITYLKPEEQKYVINNIMPEGVDISKLTQSITTFNPNPLTLDFVDGLLQTNNDNF